MNASNIVSSVGNRLIEFESRAVTTEQFVCYNRSDQEIHSTEKELKQSLNACLALPVC